MSNENECARHSAHETDLKNIKYWQKAHEEVSHLRIENDFKEIRDDIKDIRNRLPNWATLVITILGSAVGYLTALVQIAR